MKVIVTGSQDYEDYTTFKQEMNELYQTYCFTAIVQDGSKGAAYMARKWALESRFPYEEHDSVEQAEEESGATLKFVFTKNNLEIKDIYGR